MTAFNSADRIITLAMRDAGYLQEGDLPTADQYVENLLRLNDLINLWQTQGLKLWLQYDLTVPLVAGQATYSLGPGGSVNMTKPMRVLDSSYYIDTNDVKRPLTPLSRDDYNRLSNVTQTGAINSFFVDKQQLQLVVTFWLVPDATAAAGSVVLLIQQQVAQVAAITDAMNFPQEWFLALRWGLADEICTGQPQAIMDRCAAKASAFFTALEGWDVEDPGTTFAPDHRSAYLTGSFR